MTHETGECGQNGANMCRMKIGTASTLVDSRKGISLSEKDIGSSSPAQDKISEEIQARHDTRSVNTVAYRAAETGLDSVWFRESEEVQRF